MASRDVLDPDHWPTLYLPYPMDIFKLFYKAHNETLPELHVTHVPRCKQK